MAAMMALSTPSAAQSNPSGTPAEQAQLPAFCRVKLKDNNTSPEARTLIAQFGFDNWLHLHHYCYGKVFMLRSAAAVAKRDKNYQRSLAIKEYSYVLNATKPDFWMRPQINVEVGKIHQMLGQREQAIARFGDAVRGGRAYLPAYLALIGALRSNDQRAGALDVATEGLRNLPDSAELKKAYFELGGKEPLPKPAAETIPKDPATDPDRSTANPAAGGAPEDLLPAVVDQDARSDGDATAQTQGDDKKCRFCPPPEIEERWRESFQK